MKVFKLTANGINAANLIKTAVDDFITAQDKAVADYKKTVSDALEKQKVVFNDQWQIIAVDIGLAQDTPYLGYTVDTAYLPFGAAYVVYDESKVPPTVESLISKDAKKSMN